MTARSGIAAQRLRAYRHYLLFFILSFFLIQFAALLAPNFVAWGPCKWAQLGYKGWFSFWDGQWYGYIATYGYTTEHYAYFKGHVFFPLYPLLGSLLHNITGLSIESSLRWLSIVCTFLLLLFWPVYTSRHPQPLTPREQRYAAMLMLFAPCAYFLYINYTEAMFMLLLALFFTSLHRQRPLYEQAILCALLTACRSTAIICCLCLCVHVYRHNKTQPLFKRLSKISLAALIGSSGLLAYMFYEWLEHGDALLFMHEHAKWRYKKPMEVVMSRLPEMLTFKPVWHGLFFLERNYAYNVLNQGGWLMAVILLIIGWKKKWLTLEEKLFCLISLIVFYLYQAPFFFESAGRYSFSLLPLYLVMARLLATSPSWLRYGIPLVLAGHLLMNTMLFARGYCLF